MKRYFKRKLESPIPRGNMEIVKSQLMSISILKNFQLIMEYEFQFQIIFQTLEIKLEKHISKEDLVN